MKTIVFSFDDGRLDTFSTAIPIIKYYQLSATINITTDYIDHPENYKDGSFKNRTPMSKAEVLALAEYGYEIAGHGHQHKNTVDDINQGIAVLKQWGIDMNGCGFASPYSFLKEDQWEELRKNGLDPDVAYIRSGIQVRREGFLYSAMYYIMEMTGAKWLYYQLNKHLIIRKANSKGFYYGVTITGKTTPDQILYLIDHMKNGSGVILIFHSILTHEDDGYSKDRWGWNQEKFKALCAKLKSNNSVVVRTTKEFVRALEDM